MIQDIKRMADDGGEELGGSPVCPPNCGAALRFFINEVQKERKIGQPGCPPFFTPDDDDEVAKRFLKNHNRKAD